MKMRVSLVIFGVVQFLSICKLSSAWDNEELEVFDVVEEVNQNFYELLGVEQVRRIINHIFFFFVKHLANNCHYLF